jgi:hypothetical protein
MSSQALAWIAVSVVGSTATGLLLTRDWRWQLGLLSTQYLGAAVLTAEHWPLGMAAAQLVTGWMAAAAMGMTLAALPRQSELSEEGWPQGRAFRLFMAGMIVLLAIGLTPRVETIMAGIGAPVIAGSVLLIGIGLLHLGSTSQITRIVLGLLTVLAGFEVFYASVEGSILVAGLLSIVILALGLVGAFLLSALAPEEMR